MLFWGLAILTTKGSNSTKTEKNIESSEMDQTAQCMHCALYAIQSACAVPVCHVLQGCTEGGVQEATNENKESFS